MIPPPVLAECREQAETVIAQTTSWIGAIVVGVWFAVGIFYGYLDRFYP